MFSFDARPHQTPPPPPFRGCMSQYWYIQKYSCECKVNRETIKISGVVGWEAKLSRPASQLDKEKHMVGTGSALPEVESMEERPEKFINKTIHNKPQLKRENEILKTNNKNKEVEPPGDLDLG